MLYFFSGSDHIKRLQTLDTLTSSILKKNTQARIISRSELEASSREIEELIGGQSLFGDVFIVILSRTLDQVLIRNILTARAPDFQNSTNHFIFSDDELPVDIKEVAEAHSELSQKFDIPKKVAPRFNFFDLSDQFGRRDKKGTWLLYRQALLAGADPRELHGILFWIVKAMRIASGLSGKPNAAAASGLNPFVFKKAATFARNFAAIELSRISDDLVSLFHDSMRQGRDLEMDIEAFILKAL